MSTGGLRVNLLPERLWLTQVARQRRRRWLSVLAVAAIAAGAAWLWSRHRNVELEGLRSALVTERARTRQEQKRGAMLAARMEVLGKQQATLQAMRADESWSAHFAELAAAVPEQVVLKAIHVLAVEEPAAVKPGVQRESPATAERAGTEVRIEGYATDHLALATLLHRLEASATFTEVRLVRSTAVSDGSAEYLDFGITCLR